jgi:SAM-dependent methyltransferase
MTIDGGPFGSASVAENYRRYLQPVIFDRWSRILVDFAGVARGQAVLDVAAGTGAASRAAAAVVGPGGRVVASDISVEMLSHVHEGAPVSATPIETLVSSATRLALPAGSVDVVLCQHGFQFMPDRVAVARELRRVLRPGGVAAIAVWVAGRRMEPFDTYAEAMGDLGIESGYGPVSNARLPMSEQEVLDVFAEAGLVDAVVSTQTVELRWPSIDDAARGIAGTPFGAVVHDLEPALRERLFARLRETLPSRPQLQSAVLGRASAP